jgi:hypothetical protein
MSNTRSHFDGLGFYISYYIVSISSLGASLHSGIANIPFIETDIVLDKAEDFIW